MNEIHTPAGNAVLVNALSSSMRSTLNGMDSVPGLVRQVIEEGSWRNFTTPRGEQVTHTSFESFVTAKPTRGLGHSLDALVRLLADDDETISLVAEQLGRTVADLQQRALSAEPIDASQEPLWRDPSDDPEAAAQTEEPSLDLTNPVDRDALELRTVGKSGGWVWALKVARNVELSRGGGQKSDRRDAADSSSVEKVSPAEFARRIGWTTPRVMRYYRAWEKGVEKHDLPGFEQLKPGVDVTLPDARTWTECFTAVRVNPDRAEALVAGAKEAGISVRKVVYAAESPGAMKAAILADERTAEAARTALLERARNDGELRVALARTIARDPVFRKESAVEARKAERAEYVRHVADEGKVRTPAGQTLELPSKAREEAAKLLAVVDDPQATPEAVAEAYETVQTLTTQIVEADPDVQLREQRTRFSKALSSTAKSIQAIDPDDLVAVADDELRTKLTEIQRQVNELAALVVDEKPTRLRAV
ncbi:hypothetical protein ACIQOW_25605 [Kitasatospora sp. NPDC091335]|uniref:hypothetical protein n=1 Tax=Kitasatospora sp. NPDC091335 TaxID=3364085 RepID=UPI003817B143